MEVQLMYLIYPMIKTGLSQDTTAGWSLHYFVLQLMDSNTYKMNVFGGGRHELLMNVLF